MSRIVWLGLSILLFFGGVLAGYVGRGVVDERLSSVATRAQRITWKAKEGSLEHRLRNADEAIAVDDQYFPAYVWKARALLESEQEDAAEQAVQVLRLGIIRAEVDHGLYLLCLAAKDQDDTAGARLYGSVLEHIGATWTTDDS